MTAAIAPDPTESAASGWLGSFVRTWEPGTGALVEDREPATGRLIATVRGSTPDDVARAAAAAAAAQPAWAATSYQERARVLRRAADIYEAHRDEFGEWTQRETGASNSKMHHESTFAYQEILNAATLPSQAYGSLMPTAVKGRLSMVRRVPAGVVGAITPWNSPSVLGMRVVAPALALGNAVVLKPDPQTPVVGGAMFAAIFAEAGLPEGLLQVVVGGADVGEALVTDPAIPVVSFTGSTAVGRRVGQLAGGMLKKVSLELWWQQRVHRPRRRRPRCGRRGRRLLRVPVPGPGLLRGRPPPRPPRPGRGLHLDPRRQGEAPADGRPVPRGRPARADRQREAAGAGRRHRRSLGRGWRKPPRGRHARGPLLPTDGPDRDHDGIARLDRRDLRAGRTDHGLRQRRRSGRAGQRQPIRARRLDLHALAWPRPGARRPDQDRHGPHQRRNAQ